MKTFPFYALVLSLILLSCDKDPAYTLTPTDIPPNASLDINQDGIIDFAFEYYQLSTSDDPVSGSSVIGSFVPNENVSILYKTNDGNLFLTANDTIFDTSSTPTTWSNYSADVVTKDWSSDTGWDASWKVNSTQNDYYLAYKFQNGSVDELGWLKLSFDLTTGGMSIVDQAITASSFIVI